MEQETCHYITCSKYASSICLCPQKVLSCDEHSSLHFQVCQNTTIPLSIYKKDLPIRTALLRKNIQHSKKILIESSSKIIKAVQDLTNKLISEFDRRIMVMTNTPTLGIIFIPEDEIEKILQSIEKCFNLKEILAFIDKDIEYRAEYRFEVEGRVYEGTFDADKIDGKGKILYEDGSEFSGEILDGKANGKGVKKFSNGKRYDGEWKDDRMHGFGVYYWPNGDKFEGNYVSNIRQGFGKYYWASGASYEGDFKDELRDGHGIYTHSNGSSYEGGWVKGKQEGIGEYKTLDGNLRKGEWKNDRLIRYLNE